MSLQNTYIFRRNQKLKRIRKVSDTYKLDSELIGIDGDIDAIPHPTLSELATLGDH